MSVVTFLIGNGFDLACGLKSKYKDTYNGYTNRPSSSDAIKSFKDNIEENIETWADFEMALARYAQILKNAKNLVACIRDYQDYLRDYLIQEESSFLNDKNRTNPFIRELATMLIYFYQDLVENDRRKIENVWKGNGNEINLQFINFNYTKVFDELEKQGFNLIQQECSVYVNSPVLHIHGTLDNNDIVLGVDNKEQLFLPYTLNYDAERTIIKPVLVDECDDKRKPQAISYIQSSDIICAIGLSLGESDLTWKNAVANWLKDDPKHHLIFFNYNLAIKHSLGVSDRKYWEEDGKKAVICQLYDNQSINGLYRSIFERIHVPVDTHFSTFYPKTNK